MKFMRCRIDADSKALRRLPNAQADFAIVV
jgi:hypothetical protein